MLQKAPPSEEQNVQMHKPMGNVSHSNPLPTIGISPDILGAPLLMFHPHFLKYCHDSHLLNSVNVGAKIYWRMGGIKASRCRAEFCTTQNN